MSKYLELADTDYVSPNTVLTLALIMQASAIIDGYCKRSIEVQTYTERIPLTGQRGHVSHHPVVEITAAKGRVADGLMGGFFGKPSLDQIADLSVLDVDKGIGTLYCGSSPFGSVYEELEITYTSGWEVIPDKVKVACGLIIDQLASAPTPNVKMKKDFDYTVEYFGNSIVTPEISTLLSEYKQFYYR